jgi:hypothetical protein
MASPTYSAPYGFDAASMFHPEAAH